MPTELLFGLGVAFLGVIGTALGLRSARWLLTVFGLLIWWFGTLVIIVSLDLVAINATVDILMQPMHMGQPFDFEISPHDFGPITQPPKDREA